MNRPYPGQSQTSVDSCIGIAIPGFPIFLCLELHQVTIYQFISTISSTLKLQASAMTTKLYRLEETGVARNHLQSTTLLKGTINKRPGFSKPGLL